MFSARVVRAAGLQRPLATRIVGKHPVYGVRAAVVAVPVRELWLTSESSNVGLYGLPTLHHPSDFQTEADRAISTCNKLVEKVVSSETVGVETVYAFDLVSDTICRVIDAAEFCRNTHTSSKWQKSAAIAFQRLSAYIFELNTNVDLYKTLERLAANETAMAALSEEQARMVVCMMREFERDGIHLSEEGRAKAVELNVEISELCTDLMQRILSTVSYFEVSPASALRSLPSSSLSRLPKQPGHLAADQALLWTDISLIKSILCHVDDEGIRRTAFEHHSKAHTDNVPVLERLIQLRHELAQTLGFRSFSEFATRERMSGSPEVVEAFLDRITEAVMPLAKADMKKLVSASDNTDRDTVDPWDVAWLTHKVKSNPEVNSQAMRYFALPNCVRGLQMIMERAFGIQLVHVSMKSGEGWVGGGSALSWSAPPTSGIEKFVVKHKDEGEMGIIYLDLFARPQKYPTPAQFVIQCGRRRYEDALGFTVEEDSTGYQLPIVALCASFPSGTPEAPVLLSHTQVETLFHEFGHAMHSILSRTELQHMSGTRGALDFVETPSHLFEYFANDYRVLREFATDFETSETIPEELVEALVEQKRTIGSVDTQSQVVYAAVDQALFGEHSSGPIDSFAIVEAMQKKHSVVPHSPGASWHGGFGHLINYGAGYYSYLYAKMFAAAIWQNVFQDDPLSPEAGEKLRREVLRYGGAKDSMEMLVSIIGREPTVDDLLSAIQPQE